MQTPTTRKPYFNDFFVLTESHALARAQWVLFFYVLIWVILSGLDVLIHFTIPEQRSIPVVVMAFIKYFPILIVAHFSARKKAARYIANVFELNDESIAEAFLSYITFGTGSAKIKIDEGRINPEDMNSPILLIGGPGHVQVNLDNVAVSESPEGTPNVLFSRSKPWSLEGFERIREIGLDAGTSQYAIIDLKDQFIKNLSISTRTKDGIPIEAHDIKIIFSVKRREENAGNISDFHSITDEAIHSLVYNQMVLVGSASNKEQVIKFPWDSTILPLVLGELEDLIMKSSLNEILANIGQKELDQTFEADRKINDLKSELTGQHRVTITSNGIPEFKPRSKITERFYKTEFQAKAAELGVQLIWIDIGTWKLPSSIILDKHKEAWQLARANAAKRLSVQRKREYAKRREFMQLIHDVVFSMFHRRLSLKELASLHPDNLDEIIKMMNRKPEDIAKEILRAFRKELLTAQHMLTINKEVFEKNRAVIETIHNAVQHIKPLI